MKGKERATDENKDDEFEVETSYIVLNTALGETNRNSLVDGTASIQYVPHETTPFLKINNAVSKAKLTQMVHHDLIFKVNNPTNLDGPADLEYVGKNDKRFVFEQVSLAKNDT